MVKKVDHLLVAAMLYEIIDVIAEVGEPTLKAFDV